MIGITLQKNWHLYFLFQKYVQKMVSKNSGNADYFLFRIFLDPHLKFLWGKFVIVGILITKLMNTSNSSFLGSKVRITNREKNHQFHGWVIWIIFLIFVILCGLATFLFRSEMSVASGFKAKMITSFYWPLESMPSTYMYVW